jgi:hypothetical protein
MLSTIIADREVGQSAGVDSRYAAVQGRTQGEYT